MTETLKSKEAARILGISLGHLHKICREGRIRFATPNGRDRVFKLEWLEEYFNSQTSLPSTSSDNRIDNAPQISAPERGMVHGTTVPDDWQALRCQIKDELVSDQVSDAAQKLH